MALASALNGRSASRVTTLMTPPSASEPYSAELGPLMTSMRSTSPTDRRSRSSAPSMRPMAGSPSIRIEDVGRVEALGAHRGAAQRRHHLEADPAAQGVAHVARSAGANRGAVHDLHGADRLAERLLAARVDDDDLALLLLGVVRIRARLRGTRANLRVGGVSDARVGVGRLGRRRRLGRLWRRARLSGLCLSRSVDRLQRAAQGRLGPRCRRRDHERRRGDDRCATRPRRAQTGSRGRPH